MSEIQVEQRTSAILAQKLAQANYDQARTQALYEQELRKNADTASTEETAQ